MSNLREYSLDSVPFIKLIIPESLVLILDDDERNQAIQLYTTYLLELFDEATQSLNLIANNSEAEALVKIFVENNPTQDFSGSQGITDAMFDVYERIGAKVDRQTGEIALLVPKRRFFLRRKLIVN